MNNNNNELETLKVKDIVCIRFQRNWNRKGKVIKKLEEPPSYIIETEEKTIYDVKNVIYQKLTKKHQASQCSRKNFACLARKLFWPLVSSYIFTQWGWRIPFGPDDFPGHIEFGESPPPKLHLSLHLSSRTDVFLSSLLWQQLHYTMRRAV